MTERIDIFGLTSDSFSEAARFVLPKGHGITPQLYPLVMREGRFDPEAFPIAEESKIIWRQHFKADLLEIVRVVEEDGEFGTTAKAILITHDGYEVECVRLTGITRERASSFAAFRLMDKFMRFQPSAFNLPKPSA